MVKVHGELEIILVDKTYSSKYFRPIINLGDDILISSAILSPEQKFCTGDKKDVVLALFTLDSVAFAKYEDRIVSGKVLVVLATPKQITGIFRIKSVISD